MNNPMKAVRLCTFLSIILFLMLAGCAPKVPEATPRAQATRDPVLEGRIVDQLQEMNAEAVPVYQDATTAMDKDDYATSKMLYEQVVAMAPEFSTAYRRLGYIALSSNNIAQAEELTRKALALEASSYNQSSLAFVLLQKDTPRDTQEAFELATLAVQALPDDVEALTILMLAAASVNKEDVARTANAHLLEVDPTNPVGHYYAGLLAAVDRKWEKAESELLYAQKLGIPPATIQRVLDEGVSRNALAIRLLRQGSLATAGWIAGLALLFGLGALLSQATMKTLRTMTPSMDFQISSGERGIRSIYRLVIGLLSVFFYISIPFAILLLVVVVGGAFYLFFLIGRIPIQLAIILVIMLFVSLVAIVRSLFWRAPDLPPGRELRRIEAPELWSLVESIAGKLGVKPVDKIYITPHAGIGVYEKGNILQKMSGTARRNLILGMGALPGLTQGQLTGILAHEYGHFSNRDTAGGNLAQQVYASVHQMAQRLIQGGAAQVFNPVWLFILAYQRIFLRITLGASRLQEVLADRYAAIAFGSQNFIEGLKSVIRQGIVFPLQANYEIQRSLELNRPISNLYTLPFDAKLEGELEKQVTEAMERPTSQYDSHPAPKERIELIERLRVPYSPVQDNRTPALHLFPNAEALQCEITARLMKDIRKKHR